MKLYYYTYKTIIGNLNITSDNFYIRYISFGKYHQYNNMFKETEIINNAFMQIDEYLNGRRKILNILVLHN